MRWSIFFMAEYGSMFIVSGLAAILFFGGWNGPLPLFSWVTSESHFALQYLANLAGCVNFITKASLGVVVMIWIRWTLPRLRIDQVITMCWKYCVPIAAFCFLGLLGWTFLGLDQSWPFCSGASSAQVRENWVQQPSSEQPVESVAMPVAGALVFESEGV